MSEQPQEVSERATYLWRGLRRYVRKTPRTIASKRTARCKTVFGEVCWLLLPWTKDEYPGMYAGLFEVFSGRVPIPTLRCWMDGRRRPPKWAVDLLTDYAIHRAASLKAAAAACLAADRGYTSRGPGFRKVDAVTGLDGRAKTGRRGKVKEI